MMKKLLLAIALLYTSLGVSYAQNTVIQSTHGDTAKVNFGYEGDTLKVRNDIKNISANTIKINWNLGYTNFGTGWDLAGFCDNILCHDKNVILSSLGMVTDTIIPNGYTEFYAQFSALNAPIGSEAVITINAVEPVSNESLNLTYIATKTATGISTVVSRDDAKVTVYPNPVRDGFVNVIYPNDWNVKTISIYNVIGKNVANFKPTTNGGAKLENLNRFPSGVYIIKLYNSNNQVVSTRKITLQ